MKKFKQIQIKNYSAKEVAYNQFEVVEENYSSVKLYDENEQQTSEKYYQNDCGISMTEHYKDNLLICSESDVHRSNYQYDDNGNLISVKTVGDHGTDYLTITYMENGYRVEKFESSIEELSYEKCYDNKGNLVEAHYGDHGERWEINVYDDDDKLLTKESDSATISNSYDEIGRLAITKTVIIDDFEEKNRLELKEYIYEGESNKEKFIKTYKCEAEDSEIFFNTDNFSKELIELIENRDEEYTENGQTIKVSTQIINDFINSKQITIEDEEGYPVKTYDVTECQTIPMVTERTIEYW